MFVWLYRNQCQNRLGNAKATAGRLPSIAGPEGKGVGFVRE
jgi:hypothetical protein